MGVRETIWGLFGGHFGGLLVGFRWENQEKTKENQEHLRRARFLKVFVGILKISLASPDDPAGDAKPHVTLGDF